MDAVKYQVIIQGLLDEFVLDKIILDLESRWKWHEDCKVIARNYDSDYCVRFKVLNPSGTVDEYLVNHENGIVKAYKRVAMETNWGNGGWIDIR